jgi:hypothetical protein
MPSDGFARKWLGLGVISFLLIGVGVWLARSNQKSEPSLRASNLTREASSPSHAVSPPNPGPSPLFSSTARSRIAVSRDSQVNIPRLEDEGRSRFGEALKFEWADGNLLARVRGGVGLPGPAGGKFDPKDRARALSRAKEILQTFAPGLGDSEAVRFEVHSFRATGVSAQIEFQQEWDGVPLAPLGHVAVDLGPSGELLSLEADTLREVEVSNSRKLGEAQARERAQATLEATGDRDRDAGVGVDAEGKGERPRMGGGRLVVWVSRTMPQGSGRVQARFAYEYSIQGRQVIVDAETGEILFRRDQRQF